MLAKLTETPSLDRYICSNGTVSMIVPSRATSASLAQARSGCLRRKSSAPARLGCSSPARTRIGTWLRRPAWSRGQTGLAGELQLVRCREAVQSAGLSGTVGLDCVDSLGSQ